MKRLLKISLQYLYRGKGVPVMIISLVIGFSTVILLSGYILRELTVDVFQQNRKRIVRLQTDDFWVPGGKMTHITLAAPAYIQSHFAGVENYCHYNKTGLESIEAELHTYYNEFNCYETDAGFFRIFTLEFLAGNSNNPLEQTNAVVLTEKAALRFFGTTDVIGKILNIHTRDASLPYVVSGVVKIPGRSHLNFDLLTSMAGKEYRGTEAYLLLNDKVNQLELEQKINARKTEIPFFAAGYSVSYYLQDLHQINITRDVKVKVWISVSVLLVVLSIAFFNYNGLYINHMIERQKEIAIRKIIGGGIHTLLSEQFMANFLVMGISVWISSILAFWLIPWFNKVYGTDLNMNDFINIFGIVILIVIFSLMLLGSHLTFYMILKKPFHFSGGSVIRQVSNYNRGLPGIQVLQFALSIVLMISAITVYRQLAFIHRKDIAMDRNVYEFRLPASYDQKKGILKKILLTYPSVEKVSVCQASPVREAAMIAFTYDDMGKEREYTCLYFQGDTNYINTLGIALLEGLPVSYKQKSSCYVNEALLKELNLTDPIGKVVPGSESVIAGVVRDFHWEGLEKKIPPSMIVVNETGRNILVKMKKGQEAGGAALIAQIWNKEVPDYPLELSTVGDQFNEKHRKYEELRGIISAFCLISFGLSILGWVALSVFTLRRKVKEIGIRKVNGAQTGDIWWLIHAGLMSKIGLALLLAIPVSWWLMRAWLINFAFPVSLTWWTFAAAGMFSLLITLLTAGVQSMRAIRRNPVEALRYE